MGQDVVGQNFVGQDVVGAISLGQEVSGAGGSGAGSRESPTSVKSNGTVSDYGVVDTESSTPDESYAADPALDPVSSSSGCLVCCSKNSSSCFKNPDYSIKETLKQPTFYVLYLVILTLSLVSYLIRLKFNFERFCCY